VCSHNQKLLSMVLRNSRAGGSLAARLGARAGCPEAHLQ